MLSVACCQAFIFVGIFTPTMLCPTNKGGGGLLIKPNDWAISELSSASFT